MRNECKRCSSCIMKNLTIAANVFSYYVRLCAFNNPMCAEPGIEVDLLTRIADYFHANLTLLHADGWGYGSNRSALSLVQNGNADSTQSHLFTNQTTHDFRTAWPLFYASAFPIVRAPSRITITTYDFSEACGPYVWLSLVGNWIVCCVLKKYGHTDAIQHFPVKEISNLPSYVFCILISILLNLFSNNLTITLAYPTRPLLPFTNLEELRSVLLTKQFTFVEVSDNDFYLSLLNLQDIASRIKIKRLQRGREVAMAKLVGNDDSLVSVVLLSKMEPIMEPPPLELCRKLVVVRHTSFPVHKFGHLFNKQNPSWLLEKLNYSASNALFGTFEQQQLHFQARKKSQFCFRSTKIKSNAQSIDEITISKSSGMFAFLAFGLGSALSMLALECISMIIWQMLNNATKALGASF